MGNCESWNFRMPTMRVRAPVAGHAHLETEGLHRDLSLGAGRACCHASWEPCREQRPPRRFGSATDARRLRRGAARAPRRQVREEAVGTRRSTTRAAGPDDFRRSPSAAGGGLLRLVRGLTNTKLPHSNPELDGFTNQGAV